MVDNNSRIKGRYTVVPNDGVEQGVDIEVLTEGGHDWLVLSIFGNYDGMTAIGRDEARKLGQFVADYTKCYFAPDPELFSMEFSDYSFDDEETIVAGTVSCTGHYNAEVECSITGLNPESFVNMIMGWDSDVVDALITKLIKENKNR